MELDVMEMARKLVQLRGNRTQDEVAKNVGISKSALSMYERGERTPRDTVKARIAAYYRRSIPYIFFNKKEHEM